MRAVVAEEADVVALFEAAEETLTGATSSCTPRASCPWRRWLPQVLPAVVDVCPGAVELRQGTLRRRRDVPGDVGGIIGEQECDRGGDLLASPIRPKGTPRLTTFWVDSGSARVISESITPGWSSMMRTPCPAPTRALRSSATHPQCVLAAVAEADKVGHLDPGASSRPRSARASSR